VASIRKLPEELIGKIAAGEVVERPASVVKELLENALDAGAREIEIELVAGGAERIRIRDDGSGMSAGDAALVFDRHATSKISNFEDLLEVETLGFRGEALSSIGAVAHVEIQTSDDAGAGVVVRAAGGLVEPPEPRPRSRGTTVEVASLFFNVPARRKFLKTAPAELRRVVEVVQGYALARPDVRFSLRSERGTVLDALPAGNGLDGLKRRVAQLFGEELAAHLAEVDRSPRPGTSIWGFVGDPTTTRGRRYFVFVNRRLLRDRAMMSSFYRAVRETWHGSEFPALFLFLDLPAAEVDVNVHPQKAEVRFREPRVSSDLFLAIRRGLEISLGEVDAPLTAAADLAGAPLSWQGEGGRTKASLSGSVSAETGDGNLAAELHEEALPFSSSRLAEISYTPPQRTPVPLSGRSGAVRSLRVLGQYKGTVILLEGSDGLYLIDQHVAHERILYERFRADLDHDVPESQRLLEPVLLEISAAEALRLAEMAADLEGSGFEVTSMSGGTVALAAVPAALRPSQAEKLLLELAHGGGDGGGETGHLRERLLDALAASLACRAAVKMHEPLSADQMEAMVAELFASDQPYACPHGRPIVLKMTDRDLESRFGQR